MLPTQVSSQSKAPALWQVGFSGHRQMDAPDLVARILHEVVQALSLKVDGKLTGFSSAAEGADLLFAEAMLHQGFSWRAILPSSAVSFRHEISPLCQPRYDKVLAQAAGIDELDLSIPAENRYYAAGVAVVESSDILVVVWNGEPARGLGGTAQMVELARERDLPLVWIDPTGGKVTWERFSNGLLRNDLAAGLAAAGFNKIVCHDSEEELLHAYLEKFDQIATGSAPRLRALATANLFIHATAISVAVFGLLWKGTALAGTLAWIKVALLLLALAFFGYARWRRLHTRWLVGRTMAEWIRGSLAHRFWLTQGQREELWSVLPAFRPVLRSLHEKVAARDIFSGKSFEEAKAAYLHTRINDQAAYYHTTALRLARQQRWLHLCFWLVSGSAFLSGIAYLVVAWPLFGVLTIILPLFSMLIFAINHTLDIDGRYARFEEMAGELRRAAREMSSLAEPWTFSRAVARVEQMLASELAEWYRRTRHLHIH